MSVSLPFFIPDTSPIFTYSTCSNCTSGSQTSTGDWQSAYSPRGDGYDITFHQTKTGTATVNFTTSAHGLFIQTSTDTQCSASISVDGGAFSPGCNITLDGQRHDIRVRPQEGIDMFQFFGVSGSSAISSTDSLVNRTLDSSDEAFVYTSDWTHLTLDGTEGSPANESLVTSHAVEMAKYYNSTASITTATNGRVDIIFTGAAVYFYGSSGPDGGTADLYFDGNHYTSLNFHNSAWESYAALLFFQTDLNPSPQSSHNICVISTSQGREVVIDYAVTSIVRPKAKATPSLPLIIGTIGGSSAFLLIFGVLIYLYVSRKTRPQKPRTPKATYPFGGLASSKASSIDHWRKHAADAPSPDRPSTFTGSRGSYSNGPDGFQAGSVVSSVRRNGGPFGHPYGPPHGSPPPEYPDFVPYRGPIEPPPSTLHGEATSRAVERSSTIEQVYFWSSTQQAQPVQQAQLDSPASPNSRVEGWVHHVIAANSPRHSLGGETNRSYRTAVSDQRGGSARPGDQHQPKTPVSSGTVRSGSTRTDEIPLSPYRVEGLYSPVSELSSAGLGGMTSRAVRAKSSVAKVWSTTDGIPSTYRIDSHLGDIPTGDQTHETSAIRGGGTISNSMQFSPSDTIAGSYTTTPDQLIGSRYDLYTPDPAVRQTYASSRPDSSVQSPLRRGVSIKSVKTMRSFFSGLLWNSSSPSGTSHLPETPALPNQIQAARPDSGIFPITRNDSVMVTSRPKAKGAKGKRKPIPPSDQSPSRPHRSPAPGPSSYSSFSPAISSSVQSPPSALRLDGLGDSPNFFIELNPNSPVTMFAPSRPGSEMTSAQFR